MNPTIIAKLADMACELDSLANAFQMPDRDRLKDCVSELHDIACFHDRRLGLRLYAEFDDGSELPLP